MAGYSYFWINEMQDRGEKLMTTIYAETREKADVHFAKKFPKHSEFLRPPLNNLLKSTGKKVGVRVAEVIEAPKKMPAKSGSGGPPTEGWLMEPMRRLE